MHKFSWYEAKSVDDALSKVNSTVSDILAKKPNGSSVVLKAGGVDLMDLMKEGLASPETIVGIRSIPGMNDIEYSDKEGLKIGAGALLSQLEDHKTIKEKYLALHLAVAHAGTPQLRNMATLGGNLAQRTRCWYFRSLDHDCYRKGTGTCYAQEGENEFHAIIDNKTCASVHASSVATALMAFNANIMITSADGKEKSVSINEFFIHPDKDSKNENILAGGDMITSVQIPAPKSNTRSYYIKQVARESHDWALADVAVVTEMSGKKCKKADVVLGAAAPVPIKATEAMQLLNGGVISEELAAKAGDMAMSMATPLQHNAYKVPVFKSIIKRAILKSV